MIMIARCVFILLVFSIMTVGIVWGEMVPTEGHLRKLIGSNCILIERGSIPPYYDCIGCVQEKAAACVDDMRTNKSYNVHGSCKLNSVKERYNPVPKNGNKEYPCCPKFHFVSANSQAKDLSYVSAAYPEGLRCLVREGCGASIMYTQLLEECLMTCPIKDPRNGQSVCYSNFNSASSVRAQVFIVLFLVLSVSAYLF